MKKLIFCTVIISFLSSEPLMVEAQSKDESAMMDVWMKYMTPGDFHKMLAKSEGKWNEEATFWMAPGAPPTTSNMSCENKMILGGRYQQSNHSGTVNEMPFEGMGTVGYDNAKKVFISTWIDNMGTGVMYMEGKYSAVKRNIVFRGKAVDPMTGMSNPVREVFTIVDDNTQTITMFNTVKGKEFKSMEIQLKRVVR